MHASEETKIYYRVMHKLKQAADPRTPEESLWFAVICQSVKDYYDCGVAQKDIDKQHAEQHLKRWLWDYNVFGLEKSYVLRVVEEGRREIDRLKRGRGSSNRRPIRAAPSDAPYSVFPVREMTRLF